MVIFKNYVSFWYINMNNTDIIPVITYIKGISSMVERLFYT